MCTYKHVYIHTYIHTQTRNENNTLCHTYTSAIQIAPRRQLSSRHRTASLLRRGLGAPPRPAEGGRHAALSRLVGYTPSEDGSGGGMGGSTNGPLSGGGPLVGGHGMMSHVTSSVPRETGAEGANVNGSEVAEEALHQLNRAAIKRRAAAAAAVAAEVKV